MRLYAYAALVVAIIGAVGWIYTAGQSNERGKQKQRTHETTESINEAISNGVGVNWRDRLHGAQ